MRGKVKTDALSSKRINYKTGKSLKNPNGSGTTENQQKAQSTGPAENQWLQAKHSQWGMGAPWDEKGEYGKFVDFPFKTKKEKKENRLIDLICVFLLPIPEGHRPQNS